MELDIDARVAAYVAMLAAIPPLVYGVSTGSHTGYSSAASMLVIAGVLYFVLGAEGAEAQTA